MPRTDSMPVWLKVILMALAVVVLGPPALALVAWLLAVTFAVSVLALKVGAVALVIAFVVALVKAMAGSGSTSGVQTIPAAPRTSFDDLDAEFRREEQRKRDALDAELEAALQNAR